MDIYNLKTRRIKDSPRTIASVLASTRAHRCFIRVLPVIDKMDTKDSDLRKVFENNPIFSQNEIVSKCFGFQVSLCPICVDSCD